MITLLKFGAPWCNPCKAVAPILEVLKDDYKDSVKFVDVNIDENPQLRADYAIRSIPAFVIVENETEIARKVGSVTRSELEDFINEHRGV